jgi:hypothetical protein
MQGTSWMSLSNTVQWRTLLMSFSLWLLRLSLCLHLRVTCCRSLRMVLNQRCRLQQVLTRVLALGGRIRKSLSPLLVQPMLLGLKLAGPSRSKTSQSVPRAHCQAGALEAYSVFTHAEREDRIHLEGLALWADTTTLARRTSPTRRMNTAAWCSKSRAPCETTRSGRVRCIGS